MQLVMVYTAGDGCTWSCENTLPIEYESAEALAVHFEEAIKKAYTEQKGELRFAGHDFYPGYLFENGVYYPPEIMTVDEWFKNHDQI